MANQDAEKNHDTAGELETIAAFILDLAARAKKQSDVERLEPPPGLPATKSLKQKCKCDQTILAQMLRKAYVKELIFGNKAFKNLGLLEVERVPIDLMNALDDISGRTGKKLYDYSDKRIKEPEKNWPGVLDAYELRFNSGSGSLKGRVIWAENGAGRMKTILAIDNEHQTFK